MRSDRTSSLGRCRRARRTVWRTSALLLVAVLVAAACSKKDAATTSNTKAPTTVSGSAACQEATVKGYVSVFNAVAELYGRKVELVKLSGTGTSTDEAAARADALKAKDLGVFAVIGGPSQAKGFSAELAANHILCIGSCIVAQPQ